MKKYLLILLLLFPTEALSFNLDYSLFLPSPLSTLLCNATTVSSSEQFNSSHGAGAWQITVKNIGSTVVYYELGKGGGSVTAVVPTGGSYGSQAIGPGEADSVSFLGSDTVACITSTGTGTLSLTPGPGY